LGAGKFSAQQVPGTDRPIAAVCEGGWTRRRDFRGGVCPIRAVAGFLGVRPRRL